MRKSRPLHILSVCKHLPNPDNSGAGIFILRRLAAMAAASDLHVVQPVPFLYGVRPMPVWARAPEHTVAGLTIRHQPMFYVPGVLKSLDGRWLARALLPNARRWHQERPFDLIDAQFGYPEGVGCMLVARKLNLPFFVTLRGFEVERVREPLIRSQLIDALNSAAGCISVSHRLRAEMLEHGVAADQIEVIPNAIDRGVYAPGSQQEARRALGVPMDSHLVVDVGNLIALKRHDVVLRALERLRDKHATLNVAIVGGVAYEPSHPAELRQLAEQLRIADRVRFVGRIPPNEVAVWLRAADVFALGTSREGCSNAVLEALATGTPVVTTPAGDNAHYVFDDVNGYLVPVDDADAMAAAIARALDRKWDREQISAALPVGTWSDNGRRVIDFMSERLASLPKTLAA